MYVVHNSTSNRAALSFLVGVTYQEVGERIQITSLEGWDIETWWDTVDNLLGGDTRSKDELGVVTAPLAMELEDLLCCHLATEESCRLRWGYYTELTRLQMELDRVRRRITFFQKASQLADKVRELKGKEAVLLLSIKNL